MSKIGNLLRDLAIEVDKYFVIEESKQPDNWSHTFGCGCPKCLPPATKELREKYEKGNWKKKPEEITQAPEGMTQTYFSTPVPPGLIKNLREEHQKNLDFRGMWRLNDGNKVHITSELYGKLNGTYVDGPNAGSQVILESSACLAERIQEPNIY
jgi:hypothetical protein